MKSFCWFARTTPPASAREDLRRKSRTADLAFSEKKIQDEVDRRAPNETRNLTGKNDQRKVF
jgi:hypothetical protein